MIRLGSTGLFICGSNERPHLSKGEAEALLSRCLADEATMYHLRALLGLVSPELPVTMDDEQILKELATRIEGGEVLLFGELVPAFSGSGGSAKSSSAAVNRVPPRAAREPAAQPIQEEPSLFPPGTDLAAMADTVQRASQSGAPFCEH